MKNIFQTITLTLVICLGTLHTMAQTVNYRQDLSIFPKPEVGYKQMVIDVPHSEKDNEKKIEFTVGKYLEVDNCNSHGLAGELNSKDLEGWGFNYYQFKTNGAVRSTMMACADATKVTKFIPSQSQIVNYNGRLPIVIYVPEDCDVQFKIYQSDNDTYSASEVKVKK